ncbi:hypothetical protein [Roseibium sp.]|uniref:hypothetical protein n=1 Tax=Roseibium sp. TaxID=1936156 RepID=UPI003B514514
MAFTGRCQTVRSIGDKEQAVLKGKKEGLHILHLKLRFPIPEHDIIRVLWQLIYQRDLGTDELSLVLPVDKMSAEILPASAKLGCQDQLLAKVKNRCIVRFLLLDIFHE